MIEEFICAKVWLLSAGWDPSSFVRVKVRASKEALPFPKLELIKPLGLTNEAIVVEVECRAEELAGPYLSKEYDSLVACGLGNC